MKIRNQLIAAALLAAGSGSAFACGTCGGTTKVISAAPAVSYTYMPTSTCLAPVGERVFTRAWIARPAPVAEVIVRQRPVYRTFKTTTLCNTRLLPVGERIVTYRRVIPRTKIVRYRTVAPVAERVITFSRPTFGGYYCPTW